MRSTNTDITRHNICSSQFLDIVINLPLRMPGHKHNWSDIMMTLITQGIWGQLPYSGKVWQGEGLSNLANHPWFAKLKPSKLVLTINNLLADLLICQIFFHQMLENSQFAKLSPHQTFPLYGNYNIILCTYI